MVIASLALMFLNIYSASNTRELMFQAKYASVQDKIQVVASSFETADTLSTETVDQVISVLGDINVSRLLITDAEGKVLYDSSINQNAVGKYALLEAVAQALGGNDVFHCTYHAGALQSYAAVPIMSRANPIGCVYVIRIKRKSDIERWAKDVYSFVCGRYGEQNVAAFIVHLDELNPHVHCTLLPIKDGRFAYKEIFAGKDKFEYSARMKQLHTDFFAEVNTKWGMERGRSVAETGARHRTTEEYRRMLSEECTTIEQQIGRHQEVLSALHSDIRLAERRVKGLTSMVENLKREKSEKEAQLSALENDMDTRKDDALTLSAEKEKLEKELTAIQGKLADKQEKLQTADRQLSDLKANMDAIEERTEQLKEEAYEYSRDVHSKVDSLLKDAMLENMVDEWRELSARMKPSERQLFDDTLVRSVAERGAEVMRCATMLFLGMVDDATTFAETRGGGGGGSDLKWGRDEDEDNRAWALRCMRMASRMMRPSIGKKPKR